MNIDLVDYVGDDLTVANAARVSYGRATSSLTDADVKLISYLMKNKHTSPFEHVIFTFRIEVPIFTARQFMRHRVWSFSEISYRYKEPDMKFFLPDQWRKQSSDNKQVTEGALDAENQVLANTYANAVYEHARHAYQELLDLGVGRELARIVLPVGLYTEFYGTVNLHNLFHFLDLRDHKHAQQEIAWAAGRIKELISPIVPHCFRAWEESRGNS